MMNWLFCFRYFKLFYCYQDANGEPLLKRSSSHSHISQSATILLVVWSANSDAWWCSYVLPSKASSKVNLLNGDTYRWGCVTVIGSSFGQIEQGVHYIRNSLI